MTSEVFGSLKCDCKEQLDAALAEIARRGAGAVLYLRQEGRGIGLANKIRAYELQSSGADTVDANRLLGLPDDARELPRRRPTCSSTSACRACSVMTNNPDKVDGAPRRSASRSRAGCRSSSRRTPFSAGYLEAKRARMAHELPSRHSIAARAPPAHAQSGEAE